MSTIYIIRARAGTLVYESGSEAAGKLPLMPVCVCMCVWIGGGEDGGACLPGNIMVFNWQCCQFVHRKKFQGEKVQNTLTGCQTGLFVI